MYASCPFSPHIDTSLFLLRLLIHLQVTWGHLCSIASQLWMHIGITWEAWRHLGPSPTNSDVNDLGCPQGFPRCSPHWEGDTDAAGLGNPSATKTASPISILGNRRFNSFSCTSIQFKKHSSRWQCSNFQQKCKFSAPLHLTPIHTRMFLHEFISMATYRNSRLISLRLL